MLGLGAIIIWGNNFKYYTQQTVIYTSHLHTFACIYIVYCYNYVYICFCSCFDGLR